MHNTPAFLLPKHHSSQIPSVCKYFSQREWSVPRRNSSPLKRLSSAGMGNTKITETVLRVAQTWKTASYRSKTQRIVINSRLTLHGTLHTERHHRQRTTHVPTQTGPLLILNSAGVSCLVVPNPKMGPGAHLVFFFFRQSPFKKLMSFCDVQVSFSKKHIPKKHAFNNMQLESIHSVFSMIFVVSNFHVFLTPK